MVNRRLLLLMSFLTLIAAGVGFMIRNGGVLGEWSSAFGFSKTDLGTITGGGLTGFGIVVITGSLITDRIGYRIPLLMALGCHLLSAVITLSATPVFAAAGRDATYWCLYVGTFLFAIGNGLCEAAINPMVSDLYPDRKTHYLNVLHAGWPGGLVLGGVLAYAFVGPNARIAHLSWETSMALFLIPVFVYGSLLIYAKFPMPKVKEAGVSFLEALAQFLHPVLLFLLLLQALIGYVELGTDSWIVEIMKPLMRGNAVLLIIYTSVLMFGLRFCAGPIVKKINPLGLLFSCSVIAAIGLFALSYANTGWMILLAGTIYGVGKTFFWPTMLGVVGEQFPKGGALTMGAVGAVGALSAGLIAGPMIGYQQDYYSTAYLQADHPATMERYEASEPKRFLFFPAVPVLDGTKTALLEQQAQLESTTTVPEGTRSAREPVAIAGTTSLSTWWESARHYMPQDNEIIRSAILFGARRALRWTSFVPVIMAGGYLLLIVYYWLRGGYRASQIE